MTKIGKLLAKRGRPAGRPSVQKNVQITKIITKEQSKALDYEYEKFLLEQRLPFSLGPVLAKFTQRLLVNNDTDTLKQYCPFNYKMTKVAKSVSLYLKAELFSYLRKSPFSLSADTSSDINGQSFLAISAKYLKSEKAINSTTKLLSILPIGETSTGESIANLIVSDTHSESSRYLRRT